MFFLKQNILRAGLLKGMTDVHSHLLPCVDDGMKSEKDSLAALLYMQETGVERIFLTPHIMSEMRDNTPEKLRLCFENFVKHCPQGIELRLAAEYMLDADFEKNMERGLLTMGNACVLVETSYFSAPINLSELLYRVTLAGYKPIIAHPERYIYMHEHTYHELKERGYKFQLNLLSLIGTYGRDAMNKAGLMIKNGLYDFVGSDIHQLPRYQNALEKLSLPASKIKELERLLGNNTMLWNETLT